MNISDWLFPIFALAAAATSGGAVAADPQVDIKTSAGTELEVTVSKDFKVVDANEHPAHP